MLWLYRDILHDYIKVDGRWYFEKIAWLIGLQLWSGETVSTVTVSIKQNIKFIYSGVNLEKLTSHLRRQKLKSKKCFLHILKFLQCKVLLPKKKYRPRRTEVTQKESSRLVKTSLDLNSFSTFSNWSLSSYAEKVIRQQ